MSEWEMVRIPDVLFFQEGPGVRNHQYVSNGIKLLNVANLQEGKVDLTTSARYISEEEAYGKYKHFLVDEGDFIIASSGIKVEYFERKMGFINKEHLPLCMNTSTIRFKTLDNKILLTKFFMYYLKTDEFKMQLSKQIVGSAQLNFGPSHLKKMKIPLPPLEKQQEIAEELDNITELIALRKHQLEKLDLLVKAKFVEMFGDPVENPMGWEVGTIRDVVDSVKYGTSQPATENGRYTYLRMNNITYEGRLDLSQVKYIDMVEKDYEKYVARKNDVLFNRTNSKELVGKTCVFNCSTEMILAGYIIRIRTNNKILPMYLSTVLNSKYGKQTLYGMCKSIVGQANINAQELQGIGILIPPLPLQEQFAHYVQTVEQTRNQMEQGLEKLEQLYRERMQRWFGG
ncbi:MAG: restriction endonuclease subunit S [Eubacteriales bacterium]